MQPLHLLCENWKDTLNSYCKKSFPKIRVRTRKVRPSGAENAIYERNILKKKQDDSNISSEEEVKLNCLEKVIGDILAEEVKSKAYKFKKFCSENGSININKMWKLKN